MMDIAIYTLTSELHDGQAVDAATKGFLGSLAIDYHFKGSDYADYGCHSLHLIYVRTGGTEGLFKRQLPELQEKSRSPFYLLTSGVSNSLAASMEILSYLRQRDIPGEIIHGRPEYIASRIQLLAKVEEARQSIKGCRLGVIGKPSDWLISSFADADVIKKRLGIELVDIPMSVLLERIDGIDEEVPQESSERKDVQAALPGAIRIYKALKSMVGEYHLQGFTLRCFDLLTALKNTGCLALARLNTEGCVAGCEGDVPALLSMAILHSITGMSGFQANPSTIDPENGRMVFAHCTIPLNMVERCELDTHFESGIGVGVRGYMKEGPVTVFKVSGDLSRCFIAEGSMLKSLSKPDLCRTQQLIQLSDKSKTEYFLKNPIGNHHIIVPGHHQSLLEEMMKLICV